MSLPFSGSQVQVAALVALLFAPVLAAMLARVAEVLPGRIDPAFSQAVHPLHCRRRRLFIAFSPLCALTCIWAFPSLTSVLAATAFVLVLLTLAWVDAETGLLPDLLTFPLLWLGLLVNLNGLFVPLADAVLGAVAGYLLLFCVYWGFRLCTGREGLGQGDLKLLAALGAWLGWMSLPWVLLVSAGLGLVVALGMRAKGRLEAGQAVSFGPWLAAAGILILFTLPGLH